MNTSVVDAQETLIELLEAAPAFQNVLVRFAPPLEVPSQEERIYGFSEDSYTLGGGEQFRNEVFALRLVIEVYKSGDDARVPVRRKWELIDELDGLLSELDFMGYYTVGMALGAESELVAYDSGYLARSVVSLGTRQEV